MAGEDNGCQFPSPGKHQLPRGGQRHPDTKDSLSNPERAGLAWHSLTKATRSPEEVAQAPLILVKLLIAPCTSIPRSSVRPRLESVRAVSWEMQHHRLENTCKLRQMAPRSAGFTGTKLPWDKLYALSCSLSWADLQMNVLMIPVPLTTQVSSNLLSPFLYLSVYKFENKPVLPVKTRKRQLLNDKT